MTEAFFLNLPAARIGLALSGGSVRGVAHIGVIKVLEELGIVPDIIVGTSVGSLIGAAMASGKDWRGIAEMASSIFWPTLLHGNNLERFCEKHFPPTFADLNVPFSAVVTTIVDKQPVPLREGKLASAINASCAMPYMRRPVVREGKLLEDGGTTCVLPTEICRAMGAEYVIASDVWGYAWCLRVMGFHTAEPTRSNIFPEHYRRAIEQADVLIRPEIPIVGHMPGKRAVNQMIAVGETAAHQTLNRLVRISA